MAATGRLSQKALTAHVNEIGKEISTEHFGSDGEPITQEEALARLLWKQALGYTESTRDDEGSLKKTYHKPVAWAQQYIYERKEGRAITASPDNEGGVRAADKVRALAKQRINNLATAAVGKPVVKGPPKHTPKKQ